MAGRGVISYLCGVLDANSFMSLVCDFKGVLTGARRLACVILLTANRKAGTKPLSVYGAGRSSSRHFQCLAL